MPGKKVIEGNKSEKEVQQKKKEPKKKAELEPVKTEPEYDNDILEETGKILTKETRKLKRKNENKLTYNQAIALSALICKFKKKL